MSPSPERSPSRRSAQRDRRRPPRHRRSCALPPGSTTLPATARHGLDQPPPPVPRGPPRDHRNGARPVRARAVPRRGEGNWRDLRAVERAGYDTRTAPRKPATEHPLLPRRAPPGAGRPVVLNPRRPKALIYANAPGRPLVARRSDVEHAPRRARPDAGRADHALALAPDLLGRRSTRLEASRRRPLPTRYAAPPGTERDAPRLVHARPPERVRDPCPRARAVCGGQASGRSLRTSAVATICSR